MKTIGNKAVTAVSCALGTAAIGLVILAGCGGSGGGVGGTTTGSSGTGSTGGSGATAQYVGTQAPGDVWNMSINYTTFTATDSSLSTTYSGSVLLEASGIYKLSLNQSTDPNLPAPAVGFAFHVPGVGLVARFGDSTHGAVVAVVLGNCPTVDGSYNFVAVPRKGWSSSTDNAYGTATYTAASSNLAINPFLINGTSEASILANISCSAGVGTAGTKTLVVSPTGSLVIDMGLGLGGAVGMVAPATNLDIGTLTSFDYRGMIHRPEDGTRVAWLRGNGNGGFKIGFYTDSDQSVEDGVSVHWATITNITEPSPGLLNGTLSYNGDGTSVPVVMSVNTVGGKFVIHGLAAGGNLERDFHFIQKG